MATCPAYDAPICSLCCTLESRCHDRCKSRSRAAEQVSDVLTAVLPRKWSRRINFRVGHYLVVFLSLSVTLAAVLALVESARGVLAAEALAFAPGVQRLVFGTVDFALDMDLSGDPIGFDFAASRLALASRAAGIAAPVAGVTVAIDDEALLRTELARARAHGFGAKLCIHPRQVAMVHAALAPHADELAWARRVVDAAAHAAGAAVQVDGRMVDKPVLLRAQALLARAAP